MGYVGALPWHLLPDPPFAYRCADLSGPSDLQANVLNQFDQALLEFL